MPVLGYFQKQLVFKVLVLKGLAHTQCDRENL